VPRGLCSLVMSRIQVASGAVPLARLWFVAYGVTGVCAIGWCGDVVELLR
jgi:hypothetical protein